MATNEAEFSVPPARVFEVLSDPEVYADWVVGSHSIRDADPDWPAVGARFHHRVGAGPFTVNDHTEVLEVDPPSRLVLRARARPFGTAIVKLSIAPSGNGCRVTMIEVAGDPLSKLVLNRLTDSLVHVRNVESLRRLQRICETGVLQT
ncbi:MAG TPA: SRPBCC domain-containing protein [Solirubrobacteraceae bacterium]|nr:SRPBCC domain-containing protein [Solirubrobacteraceae bacterium]